MSFVSFGDGVSYVLRFCTVAYLSSNISLEILGAFFLYQAILSGGSILADLGIQGAIIKRMSEGKDVDEFFSAGLLTIIGLSFITSLLILSASGLINSYVGRSVSVLIVVSLIPNELAQFVRSSIQGEVRTEILPILSLAKSIVWLSGAVLATWSDPIFLSLVTVSIASNIFQILIGAIFLESGFSIPKRFHFENLASFAKYDVFSYLEQYIVDRSAILIIGLFLSNSMVSVYEIAWRVSSVFLLVNTSIVKVSFPKMSSWSASNAYGKIENLIKDVIFIGTFFVIPGIFGSIAVGSMIFESFFDITFENISILLSVLILSRLFEGVGDALKNLVSSIGRPDLSARSVILNVILQPTLCYILIPPYGLFGGVISVCATLLCVLIYVYYIVPESIEIQLPIYEAIALSLISAIMLLALINANMIMNDNGLFSTSVVVVLGVGVYIIGVGIANSIFEFIDNSSILFEQYTKIRNRVGSIHTK
ncbi:oligosaccharide flippase family protein [Haloarcula quadrata]|nr:polysaccharide biosynthesis C-terminal domain-containing protein [Haloarcula quadrata]